MQTSTLLKIGIIGMFTLILAAVAPLLAALFGHDGMSMWVSMHVNEADTTVLMMFFAGMILFAMMKKAREKHLEDTRRHP